MLQFGFMCGFFSPRAVLEVESRALSILSKCSTSGLEYLAYLGTLMPHLQKFTLTNVGLLLNWLKENLVVTGIEYQKINICSNLQYAFRFVCDVTV